MKIEAHIIAWNEAEIIGLVIKHYQKFCNHITIYDNYSSDSTQLIAESMGCDVKKFGIKGQLDDQAYLDVKNNCWKDSDADWVIVCDCDEILFESNDFDLGRYLGEIKPHLVKPYGWNVYSEGMPIEDITEITNGYYFENYSKCVLFSPKLKEIGFKPGAHICEPKADFDIQKSVFMNEKSGLYLLHYKNIGGVERLLKRNTEYRKRLSYNNKKMGYGIHYHDSEDKIRKEWNERIAKSVPLI
jgi:glycosyltransferase involved in cell wall biosynthesis